MGRTTRKRETKEKMRKKAKKKKTDREREREPTAKKGKGFAFSRLHFAAATSVVARRQSQTVGPLSPPFHPLFFHPLNRIHQPIASIAPLTEKKKQKKRESNE